MSATGTPINVISNTNITTGKNQKSNSPSKNEVKGANRAASATAAVPRVRKTTSTKPVTSPQSRRKSGLVNHDHTVEPGNRPLDSVRSVEPATAAPESVCATFRLV